MPTEDDASSFCFVASAPTDDIRREFPKIDIHSPWPIVDATRSGMNVIVSDALEMERRYPHALPLAERVGIVATVFIPFKRQNITLGVLSVGFGQTHVPSSTEMTFLGSVADQCALAMERAKLFSTERRMRIVVEDALARSAAASSAKRVFLAEMSHELRTPLQAIDGYLQYLKSGKPGVITPAQHDAIDRIGRGHHRITRLVNEVLDLALIENGDQRLQMAPVPVWNAVHSAEALITPQHVAASIDVILDGADGPHASLQVFADYDRVHQILLNLLANAVNFTPPSGSIVVRAEPASSDEFGDSYVDISVSDTGIGTPETHLESIFDPFVQVVGLPSASPSNSRRGVGLGLTIIRQLARRMGGEFRVRSVISRGSTFILTLHMASSYLTPNGHPT